MNNASRLVRGIVTGLLSAAFITPAIAAPVTISRGTEVTGEDIAQFDAMWMTNAKQRLYGDGTPRTGYEWDMKNRQGWLVRDLVDDMTAMMRMFEVTRNAKNLDPLHSMKYLDHL